MSLQRVVRVSYGVADILMARTERWGEGWLAEPETPEVVALERESRNLLEEKMERDRRSGRVQMGREGEARIGAVVTRRKPIIAQMEIGPKCTIARVLLLNGKDAHYCTLQYSKIPYKVLYCIVQCISNWQETLVTVPYSTALYSTIQYIDYILK